MAPQQVAHVLRWAIPAIEAMGFTLGALFHLRTAWLDPQYPGRRVLTMIWDNILTLQKGGTN